MRLSRFAIVVTVFCVCDLIWVSGAMEEYSLLMSFTATSRGNTYRYDAEVALHYTFPLFGWYNSTLDVNRNMRGRERLQQFLTKPLTYLEQTRQVLLNQGSKLSVRYDCFLGRTTFRCLITQYRDGVLIVKATLPCDLQTSLVNYDACIPESVVTWGDGKRLIGLLNGNAMKPETEAFPDLYYNLNVAQNHMLQDSRPQELRVVAYVNSEKTTITCQAKSDLKVRFRIKCEAGDSIPAFDDSRVEYSVSPGSRLVYQRTVEAHATVKLNSTSTMTAKCTVKSALGWIAVFEVTWRPEMGNIGGQGLPMSLKSRSDLEGGYTIPDVETYETNLYKEVSYEYEPRTLYLGMTLSNLVSVVVLSILFLSFIGSIVLVWRKNVTVKTLSCFCSDRQLSSVPSVGPRHRTQTTPNVNLEMSVTKTILNKRP